eukprot:Skav214293  [mRNA]  locus=scaffold2257:291694:292440:+ [translate_table: standard]
MANDPFGASHSLRYWLHSHFVVLGTVIAVSARAGVFSWLGKVAFSWDYQQIQDEVVTVNYLSYFPENAWKAASQGLGYDPQGWKAQAAALARLLVFHLWQPATYVAIFYVYAPLLWSVSPSLGMISSLVLLREGIYAGFSMYIYAYHRAFLLSMKHAKSPFLQLIYVISPDKMMVSGMKDLYFDWRRGCFFSTLLVLFVFDAASFLGLAMGLTAQVLELPIVVVWSLTAAAPVLAMTLVILKRLGYDL